MIKKVKGGYRVLSSEGTQHGRPLQNKAGGCQSVFVRSNSSSARRDSGVRYGWICTRASSPLGRGAPGVQRERAGPDFRRFTTSPIFTDAPIK